MSTKKGSLYINAYDVNILIFKTVQKIGYSSLIVILSLNERISRYPSLNEIMQNGIQHNASLNIIKHKARWKQA
jgi:hypothetical protein